MRYRDLKISPIKFYEREHLYLNGEQELTGVTSVMKAVLFPNKYDGIPESVLRQASRRGSDIHLACQTTDLVGTTLEDFLKKKERGFLDDLDYPQETENYLRIKAGHGIKMIANEYLVSDEVEFATMLDCIDDKGNLYDIKTTAELDTEYLSWQLSIGAYLFEKQNPLLKAGKLYGVWLRGDINKLVEVKRKSDEEVEAVLEAYRNGEVRINNEELKMKTDVGISLNIKDPIINSQLSIINSVESQIIEFKEAIKTLEAKKQESLSKLEEAMKREGVKKLETERILVTLVEPSKSKTLDTARLRAEQPEIAEQYVKETERKGFVKITLRAMENGEWRMEN